MSSAAQLDSLYGAELAQAPFAAASSPYMLWVALGARQPPVQVPLGMASCFQELAH